MGRPKKIIKEMSASNPLPIAPGRLLPMTRFDSGLGLSGQTNHPGYNMYLVPQGYQPILIPVNNEVQSVSSESEIMPNRIPRAQNCFILYRKDKRKDILQAHPGATNKEVSKMAGNLWRNESEEVKKFYQNKANEAKKIHQLKYPYYRYCPRLPKSKLSEETVIDSDHSSSVTESSNENINAHWDFDLINTDFKKNSPSWLADNWEQFLNPPAPAETSIEATLFNWNFTDNSFPASNLPEVTNSIPYENILDPNYLLNPFSAPNNFPYFPDFCTPVPLSWPNSALDWSSLPNNLDDLDLTQLEYFPFLQ